MFVCQFIRLAHIEEYVSLNFMYIFTYPDNKLDVPTNKGGIKEQDVFIRTYMLIMAHAFSAAVITVIFGIFTFNLLFSFYNLYVRGMYVKYATKNIKNYLCTLIFVPQISAPLKVSIAFIAESLSAYLT